MADDKNQKIGTEYWTDPEFQVLYSPPSYDSLDPSKDGVYKFIMKDGAPVGVVWTDLLNGAGVIVTGSDNVECEKVRHFLSDMSEVKFPASQAYTLTDTKAVTDGERTGKLKDVLDAVEFVGKKGEIPEEKEENLDD